MQNKKNFYNSDKEKKIKKVGTEQKRPIRNYKKVWEEYDEEDDLPEDMYYSSNNRKINQ